MIHLSIIVNGKVQGVFFRASAKEIADQLHVTGFAQNQPDGSVYIEAEGAEDSVNKFSEWCKLGPPRAHVADTRIEAGELRNFKNFEIRR